MPFTKGHTLSKGKGRPKKSPQDVYDKAMRVLDDALKSDDEKLAIRAADILVKVQLKTKAKQDSRDTFSPWVQAVVGFLSQMQQSHMMTFEQLIEKMNKHCVVCKKIGPVDEIEIIPDDSDYATDKSKGDK